MLNNLSEKHEEYKNFTPLISAILNVPIVVDPVPQDDDRAFQNPNVPEKISLQLAQKMSGNLRAVLPREGCAKRAKKMLT